MNRVIIISTFFAICSAYITPSYAAIRKSQDVKTDKKSTSFEIKRDSFSDESPNMLSSSLELPRKKQWVAVDKTFPYFNLPDELQILIIITLAGCEPDMLMIFSEKNLESAYNIVTALMSKIPKARTLIALSQTCKYMYKTCGSTCKYYSHALQQALKKNSTSLLTMVEKNTDKTCLHMACFYNRLDVVKYLLHNEDNKHDFLFKKDSKGQTAFMKASIHSTPEALIIMLKTAGTKAGFLLLGMDQRKLTAMKLATENNKIENIHFLKHAAIVYKDGSNDKLLEFVKNYGKPKKSSAVGSHSFECRFM